MEKLAEEDMDVTADEESGTICCNIKQTLSDNGKLLMDSMILGLSGIAEQYGGQYLKVKFKEV